MTGVPITITVPIEQYPSLALIAELRGYETIGEYFEGLLGAMSRRTPAHDEVQALVLAGLSDADIADETGLLLLTVASRRRALKLPPNRRYPTRKATQ